MVITQAIPCFSICCSVTARSFAKYCVEVGCLSHRTVAKLSTFHFPQRLPCPRKRLGIIVERKKEPVTLEDRNPSHVAPDHAYNTPRSKKLLGFSRRFHHRTSSIFIFSSSSSSSASMSISVSSAPSIPRIFSGAAIVGATPAVA